jgi:DNA-binding NarL/FixJ family response regulator
MAAAKTMNPPYELLEHVDDSYKLCERLDGLPLALELAAACTPFMTPKAILGHLETYPSLPQLELPDRPERQQNLVAVVRSSLSLLSENEQTFFRRLGVMVGSFSIEAAEAITDVKTLGLDALSTLVKLRNHSLLTNELTTPPRFKFLETIRMVALELLREDTDSFAATRTRHLHYFRKFVDDNKEQINKIQHAGMLDVFIREQGNLRVALDWASQQDNVKEREHGVHLASSLTLFWALEGQSAEARRWLEKLRGSYPATVQAKWLYALAITAEGIGDTKDALELAKECLRLARVLDDKPLIAKTFNLLGSLYLDLSEPRKALEHFEDFAHLAVDTEAVEMALNNKGIAHKNLGQNDKAKDYYLAALTSARTSHNVRGEALYLNNLALCFNEHDPLRLQYLEEAHRLFHEVGDKRKTALALINMSGTLYESGQQDRGTTLMKEGLVLSKKIADRYLVTLALLNLGSFARDSHDDALADQYLAESLELAKNIHNPWLEANALVQYAKNPHLEPAVVAGQQLTALGIALELQLWDVMAIAVEALSNLELTLQQYERAVTLWQVAKKMDAHYALNKNFTDEVLEKSRLHLSPEAVSAAMARAETVKPQELYHELCDVWKTEIPATPRQESGRHDLSSRQSEILKLLAEGHSNKKIAKVLGVAENTIKYHLKELFNKLEVNSRTEAVAQAGQRRLL